MDRSTEVVLNSSKFKKNIMEQRYPKVTQDANTDRYKDKRQQNPSNEHEIF